MTVEKAEMYYDQSGYNGGRNGCYKVRLVRDHSIWGAGNTPTEAQQQFINTAASLEMSDHLSDYLFEDIGKRCDCPEGIAEIGDILMPT